MEAALKYSDGILAYSTVDNDFVGSDSRVLDLLSSFRTNVVGHVASNTLAQYRRLLGHDGCHPQVGRLTMLNHFQLRPRTCPLFVRLDVRSKSFGRLYRLGCRRSGLPSAGY